MLRAAHLNLVIVRDPSLAWFLGIEVLLAPALPEPRQLLGHTYYPSRPSSWASYTWMSFQGRAIKYWHRQRYCDPSLLRNKVTLNIVILSMSFQHSSLIVHVTTIRFLNLLNSGHIHLQASICWRDQQHESMKPIFSTPSVFETWGAEFWSLRPLTNNVWKRFKKSPLPLAFPLPPEPNC